MRAGDDALRIGAKDRKIEGIAPVDADHDQISVGLVRVASCRDTPPRPRGLDRAVVARVFGMSARAASADGYRLSADAVDVRYRPLLQDLQFRRHIDHVQRQPRVDSSAIDSKPESIDAAAKSTAQTMCAKLWKFQPGQVNPRVR
jgi:hypothetical protein